MLARDDTLPFRHPRPTARVPTHNGRPAGRMAGCVDGLPGTAREGARKDAQHGPGARGGGAFVDFGGNGDEIATDEHDEERAWIVADWADRCSICGRTLTPAEHGVKNRVRRVCDECRVPAHATGRLR